MSEITIEPSGEVLGVKIEGLNLARPPQNAEVGLILRTLGEYGVVCFPGQRIEPAMLRSFSERFGTLEVNVAGAFFEPGLPEVMILSNIIRDGRPIGLADAGQGWHTDMSYSSRIAFANVLYAVSVPRRDGRAIGDTEFLNMHAAYADLPDAVKAQLRYATARHDFNKFWEMMRQRQGSTRPPLTEAQRRQKPPVSQPIFLKHPITGRDVLYVNPGYAVRIDGMSDAESERMLDYLFAHQSQPKFRYAHHWTEGDVLMWDNIGTVHRAIADYGPSEHRLMKRCQVMADRVFERDFVSAMLSA